MLIRHLAAATTLALLAACGGGGSDSPTAKPQAVETVAVVNVYGDSIAITESEALAQVAPQYAVRANAVSGRPLKDAIRLGLVEEAIASDADVIVIAYGTNDARMIAGSFSPLQYGEALRSAAVEISASGKRVVIETPPNLVMDIVPAGKYVPTGTAQYIDAAVEAARYAGAVLCDRSQLATTASNTPDGTHPGAALTDANARALAGCIKAALRD